MVLPIIACSNHPNVIHEKDHKWYFWTETWSDEVGPYETRKECEVALDRYCREELGYSSEELEEK